MKKILNITIAFTAFMLLTTSCMKDLDTVPIDPDQQTSVSVYEDPSAYKQVLAKLYAGLAVSGQTGPAGNSDISGIDEGFGQYLRGFWYHEELPTDEAVIGWNDQTVKDFHWQSWGTTDVFIAAFYYRIFYQISLANEFIRETTDAKLDERGITGEIRTNIEYFRAEARWLRALSYWHALDFFGNVPFVTENDQVGKFFPERITRANLFNYIESELKDIEPLLMDAGTNEYARADKAADWMLLAKLYLNAEVYLGSENGRYTDCITYCKKIIDAGYTLSPDYSHLLLADNNLETNEIIFPVAFDGAFTKTWGGTTFIIHAAVGGDMNVADFGIDGGWGGTRTTKAFVQKFYPDITEGLFHVQGRSVNAYPLMHVPGSYQGWDVESDSTVLASVNSDANYEGYLYFADANTEFKFAPMPNWDINWGDDGADGTLERDGANIVAADPGYYKINVDTSALTYTIEKTDWGVIGDATAGGWDSDQNMEFDPATGLWTARLDLVAGTLKFRANDDWAINYGDTGADGILVQDGDNIVIEQDGTYNITLDLGAPDYTYSIERTSFDHRAMFFTEGQSLDINDIGLFTDGYAITKFKNVDRNGNAGSDLTFPDTDFPMFRLADVYLMYAEAVLRGGTGGDEGTALQYVNLVRERAYGGSTDGDISASDLTLDFILDERARELYWEGHRRTDLVRFNKLTGNSYLWPWKGNLKEGRGTDAKYNLFPIPDSDLGANPNLVQNPGY
jgi:hypothetical protein